MTTEVTWEEPPPSSRGGGSPLPVEVLDALRQHPGRWAKVREYTKRDGAASAVTNIRSDCWNCCRPAADWEATSRRQGSGSALYLRYVGTSNGRSL